MKKIFIKIMSLVLVLATVSALLLSCSSEKGNDYSDKSNNGNDAVSKSTSYFVSETESQEASVAESSTVPEKPTVDAFSGIKYTVSGISPFCKVAVNTANCSDDAQRMVEYKLDKEQYANGETVTVTAELRYSFAKNYVLKTETATYKIEKQPEFVTSLSDKERQQIEKELKDYIKAETSKALSSTELFGTVAGSVFVDYSYVSEGENRATYFSSLKRTKRNEYYKFYNSLSYIYKFNWTKKYDNGTADEGSMYVNISALNIVRYSDGTITWGSENLESCDMNHSYGDTVSAENCISTTVMCNSDRYDITKIE